ncbi:MAG: Calx-beta domain-containing protein [Vicinamibacteria bacterium]
MANSRNAVQRLLLLCVSFFCDSVSAQTLLTLNSQAGDPVGQGAQVTFTPADGTFEKETTAGHVGITFETPSGSTVWSMDFDAKAGQPLILGIYEAAEYADGQHSPVRPGLHVSGTESCSDARGRFLVRQVVVSGGVLQSFAADFEQHCEGADAALYGSIRINSTLPVESRLAVAGASVYEGDSGTKSLVATVSLSRPSSGTVTVQYATANLTAVAPGDYTASTGTLTFNPGVTVQVVPIPVIGDTVAESDETFRVNLSSPTGAGVEVGQGDGVIVNDEGAKTFAFLNSQTGDYIGGGEVRSMDPLDSQFSISGSNSGVHVTSAGTETWSFQFEPPAGGTLLPGAYENVQRHGTSGSGGLDVGGDHRGCNLVAGRFVIYQVAYDPGSGQPTSLTADFEQHCEGSPQALFGSIRYNYNVTSVAPVQISINDVTVSEGDEGSWNAVFNVSLSAPINAKTGAAFTTAGMTATQGSDYQGVNGFAIFERGASIARIAVLVTGDFDPEFDETFAVNLLAPSGATISDAQGIATIDNDDFVEPDVITGAASSITRMSATLAGQVKANALPTTAFFQYQDDENYGGDYDNSTPEVAIGSSLSFVAVNASITGLTCSTLYHYRLVATNETGSTEGDDETFSTAPCLPTSVVTGPPTSQTQTGATLHGTVNPNSGPSTGRFQYGPTIGYGATTAEVALGSGAVPVAISFVVTGLDCNSTYHFRAVGHNALGDVNGGDETFTTAPCPPASEGNIYSSSARPLAPNSATGDTLSPTRTEIWYRAPMHIFRSYQISAWTLDDDGLAGTRAVEISIFSNSAGTMAASPAPREVSSSLEGSPNGSDAFAQTVLFRPNSDGVYWIRVVGGPGALTAVNVTLRETTLFSPWFFVASSSGYESFHTIHNNTAQPVEVVLRAFGPAGLIGFTDTFSIPANATVFRTASGNLQTGNANGGTILTHDGAFGAISANTTTLSGVTGLSFDSPFAYRDGGVLGAPMR